MSIQIITKKNALPNLYQSLQREVNKAVLEVGERMYDTAYELVPVDTGDLRRSLFVEPSGDGSVVVGAGEEYALYVEAGTRHMAAQPFLVPAFEAHKDEVADAVGDVVRRIVGGP